MTRDDIIRMAREANIIDFRDENDDEHVKQMVDMLEHVVALAAAAEREECVRLCESGPERRESNGVWVVDHFSCAEALRARGKQ